MKTSRKKRSARGLGLIEIVVYITIVAMLMSAVAVASACPGGTHPCGVVSCCKD